MALALAGGRIMRAGVMRAHMRAGRYTVAGRGVILAHAIYGGIYAIEWRGAFFMACI